MDSQLPRLDELLITGLLDQTLGQCCRLTACHHPPDRIATKDIEDHIKVEVGPLPWPEELCYIPRPNFIWPYGQKLGLLIDGMAKLVPSLPHLLISSEDSIHGADGTQIFFLIEQSGIDLLRGLVHEPLGVKGIEHYLLFLRIKSPGRGR